MKGKYKPILSVKETERAIVEIKDFFQLALSTELNLTRVTAPLFLESGKGINDDLNGIEPPVSFNVPYLNGEKMEIVQSLAKWKRLKLAEMKVTPGFGIYTDMNAIRPSEALDRTHSLYVDQWDWEAVIRESDRTIFFLFDVVKKIYRSLKRAEFFIFDRYPKLEPQLPDEITLIYTDDLLRTYPNLSPKERENAITRKHRAVFLAGIGGKLPDGSIHDGRAPDYDDWITDAGDGHVGLNGDILVWDDELGSALELSSMGIRVSPESLTRQLEERGASSRKDLYFHKLLLSGSLPATMGGGIGQSRLCMFLLRKSHIGEVQVSIWGDEIERTSEKQGVVLL